MPTKKKPTDFQRKLDEFKQGPQSRAFSIVRSDKDDEVFDVENRTAWISFSSEEPYERWFGNEILGHGDDEVDLTRMQDAPFLVNHDWDDQVGVIEEVRIDDDRRGRALVRFGRSVRADEIFNDVVDGIRRQVSVGYMVNEMKLITERDDGPDDYRVKWAPYENSIVSVAADPSVGVGRHDEALKLAKEESTETVIKQTKKEIEAMPDPVIENTPAIDVKAEINNAVAAEKARTDELLSTGAAYNAADLAQKFIKSGGTVHDLNQALLERGGIQAKKAEDPSIGMSEKDLEQFSFTKLIAAMSDPNDVKAHKAAAFEMECSRAAADKLGKDARGFFIPHDALMDKRDLTVAGEGANLVADNLMSGSFIDMLTNMLALQQCGATVLTGLNGNLSIPRQTGGTSSFWVAEDGAPTESDVTFDQVQLTPKTVGAFTEYTRKTLKQSSIAVENFVRMDLARTLALAIDLAGINGSGASNEPLGIMNVSGVGNGAVGGTNGGAPTWAHMVAMESDITSANADLNSLCYLTNALVRGSLKTTEKFSGSGREIWTGDANPVNGYRAVVSNQVPSDLDKGTATDVCSAALFGNFADVLIGMWGGLDLQTNPYSKDTSGAVRVTAFQDVDVAVRHAESFSVFNDILTA
ncbi:MAG: phage major capsid protein [Planctomycetaceae bacterium]|nr:phage major capsid protein [Planctomycetaceae bacterium]